MLVTYDELYSFIKDKIVERSPEKDVQPESKLREDLEFESLAFVEFVIYLEEKYKIEVSDDFQNSAQFLVTVDDLVTAFVQLINEGEENVDIIKRMKEAKGS